MRTVSGLCAMKKVKINSRSGLLAAGNWIIDQVKIIDVYPQPEQLANIRGQAQGTGLRERSFEAPYPPFTAVGSR